MDIQESLRKKYEIGQIVEVHEMSKSNRCYLIVTEQSSYVYKNVDRLDFINVYHKVHTVLNKSGFIQAKVIPTKNHELMSADGYSLFEYISGDALEKYDDEQFKTVVKFLNGYNEILRQVPFEPDDIKQVNIWDKVKSVEFMCDSIESIIDQCLLDSKVQFLLRNSRNILLDNVNYFNNVQKQLIHSDLGPGNIVFKDNKIKSIIDFTPEYEHELYS
jgi:Ser/Thr protein kinase RdoA (MazF antagonist)